MDTQQIKQEDIVYQLDNQLFGHDVGYHLLITIEPSGKTSEGLDYAPCKIEIVVLEEDGAFVAYRYDDDHVWLVGTHVDVADYWLTYARDEGWPKVR